MMRWIVALGLLLVMFGLGVILMPVNSSAAEMSYHGTPVPTATPQEMTFSEDAPTYYQHIKPIFETHCTACHTGDGIGVQDFSLTETTFTPDIAADLAFMTGQRIMPPWMPGGDSPKFKHERKMTDAEIALIEAWAAAGAPMGDAATAVTATPIDIPSVRADVVLEMPEAYTPDSSLQDDYRCFLLDPAFESDTFMTAYEIQPGVASIVHHVLLYKLPAFNVKTAERIDARDNRLGWQCFGDSGVGDSPVIGAWAPGTFPTFYNEGTGHLIEAGERIVMQVHYNLSAGAQPDQTRAILQLEAGSAAIQPLDMWLILAPVEIPCPAGVDTPACDRETAIQRGTELNPGIRAELNGTLQSCRKTVEDYTSQDGSAVTSTCTYPIYGEGWLVEILPHMHTRGTHIRVELNPDTPQAQTLIDIPFWDFHWQGGYHFEQPIELHFRDTVKITCEWDNSRTENPRYIVWGEGTDDEMCLAFLTVQPAQ